MVEAFSGIASSLHNEGMLLLQNMDPMFVAFIVISGLAALIIVGLVLDAIQPKTGGAPVIAKVLEREHKGELNATGVGPSFSANGPGMTVTSIHEDEKWNLVIQSQERGVESVQVPREIWARADKGTRVTVTAMIGRWFRDETDLKVALS
jgi:hypothetical protein